VVERVKHVLESRAHARHFQPDIKALGHAFEDGGVGVKREANMEPTLGKCWGNIQAKVASKCGGVRTKLRHGIANNFRGVVAGANVDGHGCAHLLGEVQAVVIDVCDDNVACANVPADCRVEKGRPGET
jgi:hypothetical protein